MDQAIERTAPLMMITAFVVLEGESLVQIKDFVVEAIDDQEDFEAWVNYTQAFFEKAAKSTGLTAQNIPREILNVLIPVAYAGIVDDLGTPTVRQFIKIIEAVNKTGGDIRKSSSEIAQAFTEALDVLKAVPEQTQYAQLRDLALGERINAFSMVYAIGQESALNALRVIPCNPQNCPFGSLDEFLKNIEELALLRKSDAISEEALKDFQKVMSDLGHINKSDGKVNFFLARGATGVVTSISKLTNKGYKIKGFEVKVENSNQKGQALGRRFMDITAIGPDGKLVQIEVKSYEKLENARRRVIDSLLSKTQPDDKGLPGQFRKDLIAMAKTGGGNGDDNRLWMFAYDEVEAKKSTVADAIIEEIATNKQLRDKLAKDILGRSLRDVEIDNFIGSDIAPAVNKLFKEF